MQIEYAENSGKFTTTKAVQSTRRYDVDWLRTLAMGLLIIYHIVISFQPFAPLVLFPRNEQSLEELWIIMPMINIWRIPILFLISGMGVHFAMERRNWKQLLKDRTFRILVPFVFGFFFIAPINIYIALMFYSKEAAYIPHAGHLWFLANIFLYVLLLLPLLAYLKNRSDNILFCILPWLSRLPLSLFLIALPLMVEAWLVNPNSYTFYANTPHGFWLGLVCFFTGFALISIKDIFWPAAERIRWCALVVALSLYLVRLLVFQIEATPHWLAAFETMAWILAILGFGSLYLNKPSCTLDYFSKAVYPVYIIHLPVQFFIAYLVLPLLLPALMKLILVLTGTLAISLLLYEYVLSRSKWICPLFGIKKVVVAVPQSG